MVFPDNRRRMDEGRLYDPGDEDILREQRRCQEAMYEYNKIEGYEPERQQALLRKMFGSIGEASVIQAPFYANWGGRHVYIGSHVYANFNLTLTDDGNIYIGDYVQFGPNVTITTAGHPIEPHLRRQGLQYNADVRIGDNVWIGAGVQILPGVTIGANTVIGAGSVVTRDIPAGVVAVGVPCRVVRLVGERDGRYYFRDREVDVEIPEE